MLCYVYVEVGNALRTMIEAQGYRGLWRGLGPTLYRDVPFSGIYWTSYEGIKSLWGIHQTPSFSESFMAGAISGCVSVCHYLNSFYYILFFNLMNANIFDNKFIQMAALCTTPFDVIKTHKQIEFGERFLYPG